MDVGSTAVVDSGVEVVVVTETIQSSPADVEEGRRQEGSAGSAITTSASRSLVSAMSNGVCVRSASSGSG